MRLDSVEEVATEKVKVAVLMAGETRIELLQPSEPGSPVARFLEKRGPGVHHLAFEVDGIVTAVEALSTAAVPLIEPAPRPGAHGTEVAFVHPGYLGGVLVELVEDRS